MMGRSLDYMNIVLMVFVFFVEFLRGIENCFFENIIFYYEYVREYDLLFIYIFIDF